MPYLTGNTIPSGSRCKVVRIPDDLAFLDALNGQLYELTLPENWETDGTITAQQMADAFSDIYEAYTTEVCMEIPVGAINLWAMATPPAKWLICNAQSVLRSAYPELFALLGTTYGAVDGTHFTLPDFNGYSPMGAGGTVAVGAAAGTFLHAISPAEMPIHNHAVNDPGHTHPPGGGATTFWGVGSGTGVGAGTTSRAFSNTGSNTTGITTANAGSSNPMSVLHPVKGCHFIIYAGR